MHVSIVASPPTSSEDAAAEQTARPAAALTAVAGGWRERWADEDACRLSAQALAQVLHPALAGGAGVILALHGTLGAGKTTFTRHLLRALGVQGRIKSPSYAVVEPHEAGGLPLWHFDFYRFADPREWEDAGFRDIFAAGGLKVVEWPEKAGTLLPAPDLRLALDTDDQGVRHALWCAGTEAGQALLPAFAALKEPPA